MDVHGWIAIGTLLLATVLFITRPIPLAMSALSIPVVLFVFGVIPLDDALIGFSNKAVISIGGIMVIGAALKDSGVATIMARGIQRVGGSGEVGLIALIMCATALLAAFMNNTAVVAILLPAVAVLSRRAGVAASKLMMPMAFAAVLGGTISLIGTAPNFIAAGYINDPNDAMAEAFAGKQINIFDFAIVGVPITIAGILYMVFIGRKLLPDIDPKARMQAARLPQEAAEAYGIGKKLFKFRVTEHSRLIDKTIGDADIRSRYGLSVVMIRRPGPFGERWIQPEPDAVFERGDLVYAQGAEEDAWGFSEGELVQFGLASELAVERLLGHGTAMADVAISPHSEAIGKSFSDLDFRKRFGLNVIALWRRQSPITQGLAAEPLEMGDAFLVSGSAAHVAELEQSTDYIVLTDHSQEEDVTRAPLAIGIMMVALLPPVFGLAPLPITAIGAAILMVATGCLDRTRVVTSIDWAVLAMLVGTLPLGAALEQTGVADSVAAWFGGFHDAGGMPLVFGALFLFAATLSVLASNAAAAAIMAPVAATVAINLGLDPRTTLLTMAYGCSCNFLLPFAQCNLLVMAPGGYSTRDYVRAGVGMSIVMAVTTIGVLLALG